MANKTTGRILCSLSGFYDVQTDLGMVTCRGRGHLRRGQETPLTGDMVEISIEQGKGMVEKILPRKNSFIRPAVANIDALVVFAANVNPVTEPFLIDRVAAIAGDKEVPVYYDSANPAYASLSNGKGFRLVSSILIPIGIVLSVLAVWLWMQV